LIGLLSASWQIAMHVPGSYGLIQDLWVARAWRGQAVGASLVRALEDRARAHGVARLEVGLPKESFPGLEATSGFYGARGFEPLGPRMRRLIE
jgi:GNAT superfamily N-acetyltransferase